MMQRKHTVSRYTCEIESLDIEVDPTCAFRNEINSDMMPTYVTEIQPLYLGQFRLVPELVILSMQIC